jgi:RNA polymerase sigma-70 factor (ECF subfamily)
MSLHQESSVKSIPLRHNTIQHADSQYAAWMVAAQAGDRSAYEMLLRDCIPFIKGVARSRRIPPDMMDDVVQETLLAVHQARQTYDPNRSFTAWLRTIAERRAIDGFRRGRRTAIREIHAPLAYENHSDPSVDSDGTSIWRNVTAVVNSAMSKLSARQRETVEQLAVKSHSFEQAARVTGQSVESLRVHWHLALKTLRAEFGAGN